jgi:hypothetical protein
VVTVEREGFSILEVIARDHETTTYCSNYCPDTNTQDSRSQVQSVEQLSPKHDPYSCGRRAPHYAVRLSAHHVSALLSGLEALPPRG